MLLRHKAVATSFLAVTALAAAVAPADAGTGRSEIARAMTVRQAPVAPAPGALLQALQRDLRLTPQAAEARLAGEARAAATQEALQRALGERWAGAWLGESDTTLTVATTDPAAARTITDNGGRATVVRNSLTALDRARTALDEAARTAAPESTPLWYVDPAANAVVVQSTDADRTNAFLARAGVDRALVQVDRASDAPRALADLVGGNAYYINNAARCSIGFPVTQGGQPGFVSAGHCGQAGAAAAAPDGTSIGSFQGSTFPGNDYSWIQADSSWTAQPQVNNYAGSAVTVSGSAVAPIGSSVCRSGSTTGWHCGTVRQFNATVNYSQGSVFGLTRTSVCAEPGDSGGSFISGSQAQGVTSGGSGNCTSGGTTYFQPVNPILDTYGLTLATG
ncbi:S1 family peptidase [Streptomyces sp. NRRL WC-3742]|uniref:S1 family peptidase n=1 Tax=Streptomyces sp. NRRL WC-3742 TaxID=1463934 RepID=UPI00068EE64B|nr:S1 family peptidase [Streptomyces sp. NRRL WC-3742]